MSEDGRLTLAGTVRQEERTPARTVIGLSVNASLTRVISLNERDEDAVKVPDSGSGLVLEDGSFRIELQGAGQPLEPITLTISTPDGLEVHRDELTLDEAAQPLAIQVPGLERFAIQPSEDPARGRRLSLVGRVIDERGNMVPAGLPVVLWGVDRGDGDPPSPRPLVVTETQAGGYFSGDWASDTLQSAFGRVAGSPPVPLRLDDNGRLPRRALLVLEEPEVESETTSTPRAPRPADLVVNPEAFSQDLGGGCVDLTVPNRAIEEFSYFMVVRTSEPDVKGMTLEARRVVPPRVFADLIEASGLQEIKAGRAAGLNQLRGLQNLTLDAATTKRLVQDDRPPSVLEIGKAAWLSEVA